MGKYDSIKNNDVTKQRSDAVKEAWEHECELVRQGLGTRDWTPEQQEVILAGGRPKDENGKTFEGHHMYSVSANEEQAGNWKNIQFLTRDEHIKGAHGGSTKNKTTGRYNPETGETLPFEGGEPTGPEVRPLSNPIAVPDQDKTIKSDTDPGKDGESEKEKTSAERQKEVPKPDQQTQTAKPGEEIPSQTGDKSGKDVPGEIPPDVPVETPPEMPGESPPEMPGEYLPDIPAETPPEMPNETPDEFPDEQPGVELDQQSGNVPEEIPTEHPGETEPNLPAEVGTEQSDEMPNEQPGGELIDFPAEVTPVEPDVIPTVADAEHPEEMAANRETGADAFATSAMDVSDQTPTAQEGAAPEAAFAENSLDASQASADQGQSANADAFGQNALDASQSSGEMSQTSAEESFAESSLNTSQDAGDIGASSEGYGATNFGIGSIESGVSQGSDTGFGEAALGSSTGSSSGQGEGVSGGGSSQGEGAGQSAA